MQAALSTPKLPASPNKVITPDERWELQNLSLYRICNMSGLDFLLKIWRNLAPLKKEAQVALEIACQQKAWDIRYKYPRSSHTVAGMLLILSLHTEEPDEVGKIVHIFLFPYFYLSAQLEYALVVRPWDTILDITTLITYTDTVSLLQYKKVDLIIRWEAAVNMLEQWAVFLTVIIILDSFHPVVYEITMLINM